MNSNLDGVKVKKEAYPLCFTFFTYFQRKDWNAFPYLNLAPGTYLLNNSVDNKKNIIFGYGGSTGIGLLIPAGMNLYIDLGITFYWFMAGSEQYKILTSDIGVSFRF